MSLLRRMSVAAAVVFALDVTQACSAADATAPAPPPRALPLPVAELKRDAPVDFEKELLPFLKKNCLACHNTTKAKGGLNLETPQLMLKGGDSGPAVIATKGTESLVFKAAAHLDPELTMPPKDNKANAAELAPEQLALLRLWIDQGAKGEVRASAPVHWLDKPPALDPILAVALAQDGQFAACGRGNRIEVYHVPSGRIVARLADEKLVSTGLTNAAHRDLVNSLAFNSDATLLASAGFREVKLWRRPTAVQKSLPALTNAVPLVALSPDREWGAVVTGDHAIELVSAASGQVVRTLAGHSDTITSLRFSPDSTRLCSASSDKSVRVWSVPGGALVANANATADVQSAAWLADSRQLATGSGDGVVRLWKLADSGSDGAGVPKSAVTAAEAARSSAPTNLTLIKELKGHAGAIAALEAVPGSKQLLSGGADGVVRLWNLDDGKVAKEMTHDGAITAVAAAPDGMRFASAGTNRLVKLWNAADGKQVAECKGNRYAYELVANIERALVVAKSDVEFRKKSIDTAEAEHKKQNERVAKALETNSATAKILADKDKAFKDAQTARSGAEKALTDLLAEIQRITEGYEKADKAAKDSTAKAREATIRATETRVAAERATLSKADAERIATDTVAVAAKAKAALNNADAAKDTAKRIADESAAVAEKSKAFAEAVLADAENKTRLAGEAKGAAEKSIEDVAALSFAAGQLKPAYDTTLKEAPDKRKQATNTLESATKALSGAEQEFKRAETRHSVTAHELELAQSAAGRASNTLALAKGALNTSQDAQRKTESDLDRFKKAAAKAERAAVALAFSPNGRSLASMTDDGKVQTWSAETGAAFDVFVRDSKAGVASGAEDRGGANGINETPVLLCFLDPQTLMAADGGRRPVAWDLDPPWTLERTIGTGDINSPLSDRVNAVQFSPDGKTLATAGGEPTRSGEIKFWNVSDGKLAREFNNVHSDAVLSLDFSPDGKYLASSSADRFVRVIDLETGKVTKAFEGHTSYVLGVAWKRDSRTLASAGADNVIKVWDFVTGERKKNIDGAAKEVTSISFVGVTDQAVATSGDGQVRMLRENGEKVRSFEGANDFVNSAAATPDGQCIVAGGQDGVLRIWDGAKGTLRASFSAVQGQ